MATFTVDPIEKKFAVDPVGPEVQDTSGGLGNILGQIPGGITEALVNAGGAIGDAADSIRNTFPSLKALDPGDQFKVPIPQFEEPKGAVAGVVRSVSQFLTGFLPFTKVAKGLGVANAGVRGIAAGVPTDLLVFNPDDPNLADLGKQHLPDSLQGPWLDILASDQNDSNADRRWKRAVEGASLGVLTEGLIKVGRAVVASRRAKHLLADPPKAVTQGADNIAAQVDTLKQPGVIPERFTVDPPPPRTSVPDDALPLRPGEEPLEKFAGSVNLERIDSDEGVKRAINEASKIIAKRAPMSQDKLLVDAAKNGWGLENAEKFARLTSEERAHFLATRQVMVGAAENYERVRQVYVAAQTPDNFIALKRAEAIHLRGFKAGQEVASNAGFALQTFRIGAKGDIRFVADKQITKLLAKLAEKGPVSDEVTHRLAVLDKNNPEELASVLQWMHQSSASIPDKIFEGFISWILSGPKTQLRNIAGNSLALAIRPLERVSSASVDLLLRPVKSRDRFFGEAVADTVGMLSGIREGFRAGARTWKTGITTFGTKFDVGQNIRETAIAGRKGQVIRIPLRALAAADETFKSIAITGDIYAQAYRKAAKGNLRGRALMENVIDTVSNPSVGMMKLAQNEAAYRTFTKELGKEGASVLNALRTVRGIRYITPFVTTPINLAKFGLERTPLKALDIMHSAAHGRLGLNGELSEELGKLAMASATMWWMADLVRDGTLTGTGPANRDDFHALWETGWRPQSIKFGDQRWRLQGIEPLATSLFLMADAVELLQAGKEAGVVTPTMELEMVNRMAKSLVENLSNKVYVQGLGDLSDAVSDPGRYGNRFLQQRARALVPSIIGQAARAQDPLAGRLTHGDGVWWQQTLETIRSQLPSFGDVEGRQGLYPRRNIFGKATEQTGNFWFQFLSPIDVTDISADPAAQLIAEVGARVRPPQRVIGVKIEDAPSIDVQLTDKEYDLLQVRSGRLAETMLDALIPSLKRERSQKIKEDMIEQEVRRAQKIAREQFIKTELIPKNRVKFSK